MENLSYIQEIRGIKAALVKRVDIILWVLGALVAFLAALVGFMLFG